jgi:hypothetical protein
VPHVFAIAVSNLTVKRTLQEFGYHPSWIVEGRCVPRIFEVTMDHSIETQIRAAVYRAFETLGANRHLLGIIGSWGDTLDDSEVLELLKLCNSGQYKENWTPVDWRVHPSLLNWSKQTAQNEIA